MSFGCVNVSSYKVVHSSINGLIIKIINLYHLSIIGKENYL